MAVSSRRGSSSRKADRSGAVADADSLTPVEWHNGIAYKREDKFLPWPEIDLNGGKVRQALKLVEANLDAIRSEHAGTLLTATGVHSPQGLIIARVAAAYGLRCRLFIGATSAARALTTHRMLRRAQAIGATLDDSCSVAYETALSATLDAYRRERGGYPIRFGMSVDSDRPAIVESIASQAKNLPNEITTLVIPVGSGITAAGIIEGCRAYRPNIDRIVCVQIAGYDRRAKINSITDERGYEWHSSKAYPYARLVRRDVARGFTLDPIYEAKAHEYMTKVLDVPRDRTAFWVVGDSGTVR